MVHDADGRVSKLYSSMDMVVKYILRPEQISEEKKNSDMRMEMLSFKHSPNLNLKS